jgi:DNA-binding winged helix-turn-helix (wHTH) protein
VVLGFGDFVLDQEARHLFRGGIQVHLQPKTFGLLDLLVRSRPKAP